MGVNSFDKVAGAYDWLSRQVFGDAILASQLVFCVLLEKEHDVLILGGGTGKLLETIPSVRSIDYVEKSRKMLQLAYPRTIANNISYYQEDFLTWRTDKKYDAILCPFFLDCFDTTHLYKVIRKVKTHMKAEGLLLVADFEQKHTPKTLSILMHWFFRITANLESRKLKDIHNALTSEGMMAINEKFFRQNMIFSRVYRNL